MIPAAIKNITRFVWEETMLPVIRWSFWDERLVRVPGSKRMFNSLESVFKRIGKNDSLMDRLPEFAPEKTEISYIPINKEIEGLDEIALHEEILFKFIEKSKHRVIVNWCGCRAACKCENHDQNIGCLMMGESALLIPGKSSHKVSVDEAKDHVRKAVANGLVPISGKARVDNDIFMIPDKDKLFTICFCCPCCCITRFIKHIPVERVDDLMRPIEGLSVEIDEETCIGCGKCVDACFAQAISVADDKAVISDMCRVCGRCVTECPNGTLQLKADNPNPTELVFERIDAVIDY